VSVAAREDGSRHFGKSDGVLRKEVGLNAKRRFKVTTDSHHDLPISPNLLNQKGNKPQSQPE